MDSRGECLQNVRKEAVALQILEQFSTLMTGPKDPVLCREPQLRELICILCRRGKNSPALVGPPGVGKTAIVEELALRIRRGQVPVQLRGKELRSMNMAGLVAGTKYRGEFEERVLALLREAELAGNILLFIDELHTVMGAGGAEGAIDAANILKPALSRGGVQIIGATTDGEYRTHIESDPALARRFRRVRIPPTDPAQTRQILDSLSPALTRHHRVAILPEARAAAEGLSRRYFEAQGQPDAAVELLDESAAWVSIGGGLQVDRHAVVQVVRQRTGIPLEQLEADDRSALLDLENRLRRSVIGQEAAIHAVAAAVRRGRSGLCEPNRPAAAILLSGPTGVGKTALCRVLAEAVYGNQTALIRLDMSEFSQPHTVSRLIGAPPGYEGHGAGGELTERVRARPYSLVLLDEAEKAHPEVLALLLQLLEEGRLTDSSGRTVDFRNTMVLLTTNAGETGMKAAPGFDSSRSTDRLRLQDYFPPELLSRLDAVVRFRALDAEDLEQIAARELRALLARAGQAGISVSVRGNPAALLASACLRDPAGVRALRHRLQDQLEAPLAELLLRGRRQAALICAGDRLLVEAVRTAGVIA